MKLTTKPELYRHLAQMFTSLITSNRNLNSYEQARLLNFAQRCKNDGELGKKTAPNIPNALSILKEKSDGRYTVQSLDLIKIVDNETGIEDSFVIEKNLKYGSKYNRRLRELQGSKEAKDKTVDNEPQDSTTEQGLPAAE